MSYDLKKVQTPRLAGKALKILAKTLEHPLLSHALVAPLLKSAGITDFRKYQPKTEPTLYPLHHLHKTPKHSKSLDIWSFWEKLPQIHSPFPSIQTFFKAYQTQKHSPIDVAEKLIKALEETQNLHPMICFNLEDIRAQAQSAARRWEKGRPLSPLDGVPIAVKDEIDLKGYPTTVGTTFLGTSPASKDAFAIEKLRKAGAILFGKTNMHEIGLGTTGLNPHYGVARNPYDTSKHSGGSSSGSAVAVALGLCPIAIGADGGGSIRIPSSLCGIVGLKPTFGRISETGVAPLCWSVAHIGPMGAHAQDLALTYAIMSGPDPQDPHSTIQPKPQLQYWEDPNNHDLSDLKIGIFKPWFHDASSEIQAQTQNALNLLQNLGAQIVDIDIPHLEALRVAHLITIASEMLHAMSPYEQSFQHQFGLDVRINLALAKHFRSNDYIRAQAVRTQGLKLFSQLFEKVDLIATPTTGRTAPPIPETDLPHGESNLSVVTDLMRFATPANLLGLPAITTPVGYDAQHLPIGFQLMANAWNEDLLLRLSHILQSHLTIQPPKTFYPIL